MGNNESTICAQRESELIISGSPQLQSTLSNKELRQHQAEEKEENLPVIVNDVEPMIEDDDIIYIEDDESILNIGFLHISEPEPEQLINSSDDSNTDIRKFLAGFDSRFEDQEHRLLQIQNGIDHLHYCYKVLTCPQSAIPRQKLNQKFIEINKLHGGQIQLTFNNDKKLNIGGWEVKSLCYHGDATFKFFARQFLKPGSSFTIWSNGMRDFALTENDIIISGEWPENPYRIEVIDGDGKIQSCKNYMAH